MCTHHKNLSDHVPEPQHSAYFFRGGHNWNAEHSPSDTCGWLRGAEPLGLDCKPTSKN